MVIMDIGEVIEACIPKGDLRGADFMKPDGPHRPEAYTDDFLRHMDRSVLESAAEKYRGQLGITLAPGNTAQDLKSATEAMGVARQQLWDEIRRGIRESTRNGGKSVSNPDIKADMYVDDIVGRIQKAARAR